MEKINFNAYRLKLPSHVQNVDVLNVKHLIPFASDNSYDEDDGQILGAKFLTPGRIM